MKNFHTDDFVFYYITCWGKRLPVQSNVKVSASKLAKTSWFILLPYYECLNYAGRSDIELCAIVDTQKK